MHFAYPIPWWLGFGVAVGVCALAFFEYRRPLAPLTPSQKAILLGCRTTVLAVITLLLFRPIVMLPPADGGGAVVPILVDASRSMRLHDVDAGETEARLSRAVGIVRTQLVPALTPGFKVDVYSVGDQLAPADIDHLTADAHHSDIAGALAAVRERYRGDRVAGIVVLSDGADAGVHAIEEDAAGPPVFAVGIGSVEGVRDREVLGLAAGDPRLDQSSVDLHVSAMSRGFGRTPFTLRVLGNGRVLETRRVVAPADGAPIDETFTVLPDPTNATVYTADIPVEDGEPVAENNSRSVLVTPGGRKRRLLIVEGAPGFEHSFMTRALARDSSLEVDSVVRKGKNADGKDTFFVQAAAGRAAALMAGFPARREDLFAYDALVVANVEGEFFTRAQLAMAADFVGDRGGGLLVLGGRSFSSRGLMGTPLEEVLPVELNDRRSTVVPASLTAASGAAGNKLIVTPEGENHPIMRVGPSKEESLRAWAALPSMAASAPLGGARPGASVLAVTEAPGGVVYPVVAVQPYGQGRSMIFAGEASWRWKMLLASSDRTHEFFWRQAARWLSRSSPDPVAMTVPDASEPGDRIQIGVDARDAAFAPASDASVSVTLTSPGDASRPLVMRHAASAGRFTADVRVDQPGVYRVHVEAQRAGAPLGQADRAFYVGGADREFADPRLNEGFLRRAARASGGRYVRAADAGRIAAWLRSAAPPNAAPVPRDLWHTPWAFAALAALLSGEWVLRRRWGLR